MNQIDQIKTRLEQAIDIYKSTLKEYKNLMFITAKYKHSDKELIHRLISINPKNQIYNDLASCFVDSLESHAEFVIAEGVNRCKNRLALLEKNVEHISAQLLRAIKAADKEYNKDE